MKQTKPKVPVKQTKPKVPVKPVVPTKPVVPVKPIEPAKPIEDTYRNIVVGKAVYNANISKLFREAFNNYRISKNIEPLPKNPAAEKVAKAWVEYDVDGRDPNSWDPVHSNKGIGTTFTLKDHETDQQVVDKIMANFIESPGHEQNLRDNWCSIDTYVVVRKNQTFSFLQAYTFMAIAEFTTESGLPGIMP